MQLSFDPKVIGPTILAKHFAPLLNEGGSIVLFSGVNASEVNIGYLGVAITNGAVDFLTRSLAVEPAPIRVNAVSPGVIYPAGRIGRRYGRGGTVRPHQHISDRHHPEGGRW